ncbi:MAG: hypothetical protein GF383_07000 [Candidatus Lokiarchaeota archaeon]|nr:hypothetical protein [Candidatus Lokiarchaeota archaeon]MBD3339897.1 hypothetical protein [Candidatus Lokiarchaeota archaeon]
MNVLCEKPICITRNELIKIENKIIDTDLIYFTSFQKRYVPIFIYLKDILEEQLLGKINLIRYIYSHKGPYTSWKPLSKERWFFDAEKAGGGVLLDLGVHCIDILCMLTGDYSNIAGYTQNTTCKGIKQEDNCSVLFRFKNDAIGIISVSWCNELMEMVDIFGTKGTLRVDLHDKNPVKVMPRKLKRNKFIKKALNYRPSLEIAQHSLIDHFIECVIREEQGHPNFFDGKKALEFVLNSYNRAQSQ